MRGHQDLDPTGTSSHTMPRVGLHSLRAFHIAARRGAKTSHECSQRVLSLRGAVGANGQEGNEEVRWLGRAGADMVRPGMIKFAVDVEC